jgi:hypothetical protein
MPSPCLNALAGIKGHVAGKSPASICCSCRLIGTKCRSLVAALLLALRLPSYHFVYAPSPALSTGFFRCSGSEKPIQNAGDSYITPSVTPRRKAVLGQEGLKPVIVETSEFEKACGSCFCLKMFLP